MTALPLQDELIIESKPPVAWLKLNRPESSNSLNRRLLSSILEACTEIASDQKIQLVVIIGTGTKIFCAGADLIERKTMTVSEVSEYHSLIQKAMIAIESLPQTVIAAINGSAYGGGVELALACDLRVMVASAQLRLTEVRLGIIPGAGGTQRLPRLIGKSKAKEMILAASPLSAHQGYQFGLINRLVAEPAQPEAKLHEPLINEVNSWVVDIIKAAPLSLRQAKQAIDKGFDQNLSDGLAYETSCYLKLLDTEDRLEGLAAFAEKRKPNYRGM